MNLLRQRILRRRRGFGRRRTLRSRSRRPAFRRGPPPGRRGRRSALRRGGRRGGGGGRPAHQVGGQQADVGRDLAGRSDRRRDRASDGDAQRLGRAGPKQRSGGGRRHLEALAGVEHAFEQCASLVLDLDPRRSGRGQDHGPLGGRGRLNGRGRLLDRLLGDGRNGLGLGQFALAHPGEEDDDQDDCGNRRDHQPFRHGPRRIGGLEGFDDRGVGAIAAHFAAQLLADLGAIEADGAGIALGEADGVGRRRKPFPIARLEAFEVAARDSGLRRQILEAEPLLLARRAKPLADRRKTGQLSLFVHYSPFCAAAVLSKALGGLSTAHRSAFSRSPPCVGGPSRRATCECRSVAWPAPGPSAPGSPTRRASAPSP